MYCIRSVPFHHKKRSTHLILIQVNQFRMISVFFSYQVFKCILQTLATISQQYNSGHIIFICFMSKQFLKSENRGFIKFLLCFPLAKTETQHHYISERLQILRFYHERNCISPKWCHCPVSLEVFTHLKSKVHNHSKIL